MINDEKYKEILDTGLILDHYRLLCNIRDGIQLVDNKRIQGFVNLLVKKGYIEDNKITDKAIELLAIYNEEEKIVVKKGILKQSIETKLGDWVTDLHNKCQSKIEQLTGKKQVVSRVNKADRKGYPFLCNAVDMGKVLSTCISNYKLNDYNKIEKVLLRHIENCNDSGQWFPLMRYFILKNGMSDMVTAMENDEATGTDFKSSQKFV